MQSDFSACDTEPIHAPGSIQSFGVLLALDANTLHVGHASANYREALGQDAAPPFGKAAAEILGPAAEAALRGALAKDGLIDHRPIPLALPDAKSSPWQGVAHCLNGTVFVELEPADLGTEAPADALAAVRGSIGKFTASVTIAEFAATAAREVRSLTGYDRVMVYQFDAEWNGEVIAEERRADLETFLGLHYPASDIPSQARALFLANRIRMIADAASTQVPLLTEPAGSTSAPLDLGRCLLRSAAAVHRQYLHNMGVRASLTASLVVDGRFWGLIACHHLTPRHLGRAERETCELLAQVASVHLAYLVEAEHRTHLATHLDTLSRIGARIGSTSPPIAALAREEADLLALVEASGAAVCRSDRLMLIGRTPPEEALAELVGWVKGVAAPLIATDRLPQLYAPANQFAEVASGLLALEVSRVTDEYVLWFRPEVLQTVNWAGDPHGKADVDSRLSPRQSFAVWKETMRGRSLPWQPAEVENVRRVKEMLQAAVSLSAAKLEALLPICAWCKKVRDEADYWRGVEEFIETLVDVRFTHGICPDCLKNQMAEFSNGRTPSNSQS